MFALSPCAHILELNGLRSLTFPLLTQSLTYAHTCQVLNCYRYKKIWIDKLIGFFDFIDRMRWKSRKAKLMCKTVASQNGAHTAAFCQAWHRQSWEAVEMPSFNIFKSQAGMVWETCSRWPCWSKGFEQNDLQR